MTQIKLRRGTSAQWTAANPTLSAGEAGLETDTGQMKFGNGANTWLTLPYFIPNHVHDAAAITTGTLDPLRIPLASGGQQGGITPSMWSKINRTLAEQVTTPLSTDPPSVYLEGITYTSINGESGWPWAFSTLLTVRAVGVNPRGFQMLVAKDSPSSATSNAMTWMRVEHDGDIWTPWVQTRGDTGPKLMTYMSSWTDFNSASYARLKATQVAPGTVSIAGMPKPGTLSDGIGIATVPSAFIPNRDCYASCTVRNSSGTINAAGMAVVRGSASATPGQLQIFGITATTQYLAIGFTYNIDGS
jgi:hypothetical protein